VAIGECGLDYYRDRTPKDVQIQAFERQLELARERDLPVIIHCRDAFRDVYDAVERAGLPRRGVMHCFSGGIEEAERAVALGMCVSFAGPLTYKKNTALRDALARVPRERVLIETDCPFLPPEGKRGKRNEPAFLPFLVHELARVWSAEPSEAAALTSANALRLFRLALDSERR
jgi:TatD DNase family protein